MSPPSVTLKKRSVLWRIIFQIEQVLVTIGFVVYALLVSINQPASLFIIMIATLTVGNLVVPLAFASRRLYVTRPFPVELGHIFSGPNRIRCDLRRGLDSVPAVDQN